MPKMPNFLTVAASHIAAVVETRTGQLGKMVAGKPLSNIEQAQLLGGEETIRGIINGWAEKAMARIVKATGGHSK